MLQAQLIASKDAPLDSFSPQMFCLARDASGLTQKAASQISGVSQGKISKIENGLQSPSEEQLQALASAFHVQVSFFYRSYPGQLDSVPKLYRKRNLGKKRLSTFQAHELMVRQSVEKLLEAVELQPGLPLTLDEHLRPDPEKAAERIRILWGIPPGPIPNLTQYLEAAGILILPMRDMPDGIDAVFLPPVLGFTAVFIVNQSVPGDRLRWTLAHELGHYVLRHYEGRVDEETAENEANSFASELLMPKAQLKSILRNVTLAKAAQLKSRWRVSVAALIRRARDTGAITNGRYTSLMCELSRKGWRKSEPIDIPVEAPSLLEAVIRYHSNELSYSSSSLAKLLHLTPLKFYELFGEVSPYRFVPL